MLVNLKSKRAHKVSMNILPQAVQVTVFAKPLDKLHIYLKNIIKTIPN